MNCVFDKIETKLENLNTNVNKMENLKQMKKMEKKFFNRKTINHKLNFTW